jgi:flagellin-specific chaperone FliS
MTSLLRLFSQPARSLGPALYLACFGIVSTLCLTLPAHASAEEATPTPDTLAQLEQRASQANPREQCFLYTQLVHTMSLKASREIESGDIEQAAKTLKQINQIAHIIHLNLAHDAKRVKDAEQLMHNTTYRLAQVLHLVSGDDKATVQETLKQLNQVNDELLTQVFSH